MSKIVINNNYIVLPMQLVEEIFPSTNATFIKIYMHIAMLSTKHKSIDVSEVASSLQLLESDVVQAVKYWSNCGALEFYDADAGGTEISNETEKSDTPVKSYETADITKEISENSKLSEMLQLAQEVLGKTISSPEMKTLYWLHDNLKFSPEVILMLLEYCVSIGKKNMQYIERVATSWHSKGINTMEEVERFLSEEEHTKNYMNSLKSIFGIRDRSFTGIEEDYLKKWHDELHMTEEMIALAYEYCILRTNKLSFPYMDKIITDWNSKNIHTIEAAEEENQNFKKNKSGSNNEPNYNDELEKFTWGQVEE